MVGGLHLRIDKLATNRVIYLVMKSPPGGVQGLCFFVIRRR